MASWLDSLGAFRATLLAAIRRLIVFRPNPPPAVTPPPTISGWPTSNTAFIGLTASGAQAAPIRIHSLVDFHQSFGSSPSAAALDPSIALFFANQGRTAYILSVGPADDPAMAPGTPGFDSALWPESGTGGVDALKADRDWSLLVVPGETRPEVLARLGAFACERSAFLIADTPADATVDTLRSGLDPRLSSIPGPNAAIYAPWLLVADPSDPAQSIAVPPSGAVAGVFAFTDTTRGVWQAPAGPGAHVRGILSLSLSVPQPAIDEISASGINLIRALPGSQGVVWGSRTTASVSSPEFRFVPVRRLALYLEVSIREGTRWALTQPADPTTWAAVRTSVETFLDRAFRAGAFQGNSPRVAYYVRCGSDTMSPLDIAQGTLKIEVGFAPLRPAEFVVFRVQHSKQDPA